ncbi:MAG: glycosyltransferase family 39 protein [Parachlamydiaceae bacterium]|nr:glycosyltransferase family 39 protein [Parachlamydiaceae bacterium]
MILSYFKLFILFLLLKAAIIISIILNGSIGLGPDEAQYWTWSRSLDWGYYSKPPGIAWQIWLGTQAIGQTELGVRILSVIISLFQALTVYFLALKSGLKTSAAFWSGILMAFCPIGIFGSLLAITDNGLLLFWTLSCLALCSALNEKRDPNPFIIGSLILAGALFKWPIYLFWIFYFLFRWKYFSHQNFSKALSGVLISLIGLLPSIWWNWHHDWATFRHVSSTIHAGSGIPSNSNTFEFIGSQIILVSPIIFVILILSFVTWFKQRRTLSPPIIFCGIISLSCLGFGIVASFFQKIQGNWVVFAYPTCFILISWYACEIEFRKTQTWLKAGIVLSIGLITSIFLLSISNLIPQKMNPLKHNLGWSNLSEILTENGYDPLKNYLITDRYQTTSILSFYGPEQKRAYFLNLHGVRNNQFSYWPQLQNEQKGKTGYFIWVENAPHLQRELNIKSNFYQGELENYFEKVSFIGIEPLIFNGDAIAKGALIFKCENCLNKQPNQSDKY